MIDIQEKNYNLCLNYLLASITFLNVYQNHVVYFFRKCIKVQFAIDIHWHSAKIIKYLRLKKKLKGKQRSKEINSQLKKGTKKLSLKLHNFVKRFACRGENEKNNVLLTTCVIYAGNSDDITIPDHGVIDNDSQEVYFTISRLYSWGNSLISFVSTPLVPVTTQRFSYVQRPLQSYEHFLCAGRRNVRFPRGTK